MNAAALRLLVEAGLSGDQIVAVAEALETKPARSPGAERVARHRARKAATVTESVTCNAAPPETKVSPTPPSKTQTPTPPIVPPAPETATVAEELWGLANADGRDRSGKPAVRKAVKAAMARGATREALVASVAEHYRRAVRGERDEAGRTFAKGLHRWIEGDNWATAPPPAKPVVQPDAATKAWCLQHYRDTREWRPEWGERPELEQAA